MVEFLERGKHSSYFCLRIRSDGSFVLRICQMVLQPIVYEHMKDHLP